MSHSYDMGGLPGEGSHMHRCPVHCNHGCVECAPEEPEVTLDTAPDCPVHGRDWLHGEDGEIVCSAPTPSDPGSMECRYYGHSPRESREILTAVQDVRSGREPTSCLVNQWDLRQDLKAVEGDHEEILKRLVRAGGAHIREEILAVADYFGRRR